MTHTLTQKARRFFSLCLATPPIRIQTLSVALCIVLSSLLSAQENVATKKGTKPVHQEPSRVVPPNREFGATRAPAASYTTGYNAASFQSILEANNCFTITSMTMTSVNATNQVGTFSNGTSAGLAFDDGIVLTTGSAAEAFTDNSSSGISAGTFNGGAINDPDLDGLSSSGLSTHDEAILEIEFFVPAGIDGFSIPFQFASDEYPEYVCSIYNDVFAVFIDGPGLGGFQKISLVPGTNNPVSVNNLNGGSCGAFGNGQPSDLGQSAFFIFNNDGSPGGPIFSEYDGFTVGLNAEQGGLTSGNYRLKLAIGDLGDGSWDSGVFFGAMSATSGGTAVNCSCLTNPLADPNGDCDNDGTLNGNETDAAAALNPCDPNPLAIGTGDCDSDGTLNQDEADAAAALDPCDPDPLGYNLGDCDNDGTNNQDETDATAALDPCDPDPLAIPNGDCDGDGITNQNDDCPLISGFPPHGCPDNDQDGIADSEDLDDDNDGILDHNECTKTNHALAGVASMSSQYGSLVAANANDGNTNGNLAHTGCGTSNDWLDIDLGNNQRIDEVAVWNRTNCCSNRMSNVYLLVSTTPFPTNTNLTQSLANAEFQFQFGDAANVVTLRAGVGVTGRYVRLQKSGSNPGGNCMNILELQVLEYDDCDTDSDGSDNLFDTDSDGDGCYDAVEGSPGFILGTQVNSDGTLSGTIQANGVPTSAGAEGQEIGDSQNNAVLGANCIHEAIEDNFDIVKNQTTSLDVMANDNYGGSANQMTLSILNAPKNGIAFIENVAGVPHITFTPNNEFLGMDTLIYQLTSPSGATSFDTVFLSVYSPLPIDLISFDAYPDPDANKVKLVWLTATEINNEVFIVYRSADAYDWKEVTQTPGQGHSNQTVEYREEDNNPLAGLSYYKLRQIDYDGKYEDSEIKVVQFDKKLDLVIYPNPASGHFAIIDSNMELDPHTVTEEIKLFDTSGRAVELVLSASQGSVEITLPGGMSAGHYLLTVRDEPHIIHIY